MCFSPEVSFVSAAVLIPVGMWAVWTAARKAPRLWPLAVIPTAFGAQQACEGFVWLGQRYGDDGLKLIAGRAYLFFALAFWPFWFCASAALIEPERTRRRLLAVGAALSTVWFWVVYLPVLDDPAAAGSCVCHNSIRYVHSDSLAANPLGPWGMRLAYILTAAIPVLSCSLRCILISPLVLAVVSASVAAAVYDHAFTSVWCLFAAVLSASLVYTIASSPSCGRAVPAFGTTPGCTLRS